MQTANILFITRGITKLYEQYLDGIRRENNLSQMEITIICFLHNNPQYDTARDIVEMRMLQKGNVSQGVESLIQKSLLCRTADASDRRKQHLALTEVALPILEKIEVQNKRLINEVFSGFSEEEQNLYTNLNKRIENNIIESMGRE